MFVSFSGFFPFFNVSADSQVPMSGVEKVFRVYKRKKNIRGSSSAFDILHSPSSLSLSLSLSVSLTLLLRLGTDHLEKISIPASFLEVVLDL